MTESIQATLKEFRSEEPASEQSILVVEDYIGRTLPSDYRSFLLSTNGGEGFVGDQYFIAWKTEELVLFNEEYQFKEYAPQLFAFGSNGAGEAFAFDLREGKNAGIVMVPFIGMSLQDAILIAPTFTEFLHRIHDSNAEIP